MLELDPTPRRNRGICVSDSIGKNSFPVAESPASRRRSPEPEVDGGPRVCPGVECGPMAVLIGRG
jgi:hypothetical protein